MRLRILALAAVAGCCLSCVENNYGLGSDLIPASQHYTFYNISVPLREVTMSMADSLSGYSDSRITVGAIRDEEYGLSTRSCALTLIPMFIDSLDLGENRVFNSFHFAAAKDTISYADPNEERILQTFTVYELTSPIDESTDFDCNHVLDKIGGKVNKGSIMYNGDDSLSFDFTEAFGRRYLEGLSADVLSDIDTYLEKFPGIYITAKAPAGNGGRFNLFDLQLSYNSDDYYLQGNYAVLRYSAEFDGERKDTSLLFYYGATDFYDLDSLLTNSSTGSYPEYCLNLTTQETRHLAGPADEWIYVEGGGGLKPKISAAELRGIANIAIAEAGGDPATTVISKATLSFPFEFPEDYKEMDYRWPQILSPTCRVQYESSDSEDSALVSFVGLTDSSNENENQGDVNRSTLRYEPDITHHLQSLLRLDLDDADAHTTKQFYNGSYDIWLLIMANEIEVTTTSGSSEMSEFYNYLAYQSYYNDIYGYGSSGYGSYYSNYYNYAMLAQLYGSSSSTETATVELDRDRYYNARLYGPGYSDESLRPHLILTIGIPDEEY